MPTDPSLSANDTSTPCQHRLFSALGKDHPRTVNPVFVCVSASRIFRWKVRPPRRPTGQGEDAHMDPLAFPVLAGTLLTEAVRFLFDLASAVLDRRAGRVPPSGAAATGCRRAG